MERCMSFPGISFQCWAAYRITDTDQIPLHMLRAHTQKYQYIYIYYIYIIYMRKIQCREMSTLACLCGTLRINDTVHQGRQGELCC